jgi:hypothetical protein
MTEIGGTIPSVKQKKFLGKIEVFWFLKHDGVFIKRGDILKKILAEFFKN